MKIRLSLVVVFISLFGTVFSQPTISSFTPASGPAGSSITITGTNFNTTPSNNIVFFGATKATVATASATQLIVTVPLGATYSPITVLNTTTNLLAYSKTNFTPTYTPYKGTINGDDFAGGVDFGSGELLSATAIGDLDGDGKPDLVVANYSGSISIYRNTSSSGSISSSSLATSVSYTTGAQPFSIAIGDLDNDGKLEIATANYGSNSVSVFRNTSSTGTISFASNVEFSTGSNPVSVAIGDLDGDGKPDLAVANGGGSSASILRNTSTPGSITTGSFATNVDFFAGVSPFSVAIGDLDGDGKPEVAIANGGSSTVSVLRNTSTSGSIASSSFAASVNFTTGAGPQCVVIGDLNSDGKPEVVTVNYDANSISIFRNTSTSGSITTSSLASPIEFGAGGVNPKSIAIGDLDGNGKLDLAVAHRTSNAISVFRNIGTGSTISYASNVNFSTSPFPFSVAIGDLDGDNKPDLATANFFSASLTVIRNNKITQGITFGSIPTMVTGDAPFALLASTSSGLPLSFSSSNTGIATVAGNIVTILRAGTVTITASQAGDATYSAAEDVTQTLVINVIPPPTITSFAPLSGPVGTSMTITGTNFSSTLTNNIVFFGATQATVTAATSTQLTVTVPAGATYSPISVLNKDKSLTAFSKASFTPTFTPAISTFNFSPKLEIVTGANARGVAISDLDGDGIPDLAVANLNGGLSILHNNGTTGKLGRATFSQLHLSASPTDVIIGDFDSDGKPDLATPNEALYVYSNSSSGGIFSSNSPIKFPIHTNTYSLADGDLDGDGKLDLLVVSRDAKTVSVLRKKNENGAIASGSFENLVDFTAGTFPFFVAIGDLDGDGKLDLAVTDAKDSTVSVYRNTSTPGTIDNNSFAARVNFKLAASLHGIAIGDLDGDGKQDIAVAGTNANKLFVLRNTGTSGTMSASSFATATAFNTGTSPEGVTIGDLNGDSKPELVVTNFDSNNVTVFTNTSTAGSITLFVGGTLLTGFAPTYSAIGDINNDGKPDIAVANYTSNTVTVFGNDIKLEQEITNFYPTDEIILGATYKLSGTATSGLAITYVSSDPSIASITGSELTAHKLGTITITANQAGDAHYNAATSVTQTLTVNTLPTITSIAPLTGSVGSTITITGTNFDATAGNNIVFFGAAKTIAKTATSTQLTVAVPTGATFAPLTIVNATNGLQASSSAFFEPTFIPNKGSITVSDFSPKVDFANNDGSYMVAMGDLDGDGKTDLVTTNYNSNTISIYHNTSSSGTISTSSFASKINFTTSGSPTSVAIGDLDGDGKLDIAVSNYDPHSISIYYNNSTSGNITINSFLPNVDLVADFNPYNLAIGDLDNDGRADLIFIDNGVISAYRNIGSKGSITSNSFSQKVDVITTNSANAINIGDLDGDGKLDLIVGDYNTNVVSVYRNISTAGSLSASSFSATLDLTTTNQNTPYSISLGDLNGDTKLDIAAGLSDTNVSVYQNKSTTGSLSFSSNVDFMTPSSYPTIALADMNGDGKLDLVTGNYDTNTVSIFANIGTGGTISNSSFSANVDFATGSQPAIIAIGDLDGDGKSDIVSPSNNTNTISVIRNILKADQTITFNPLADKLESDAPFVLAATVDTSLPLTYSASPSNRVTITSTQVTITSAGRVTITASQSGNAIYNAASASQSFCIKPTKPIINVTNANTVAPTLTSSTVSGNQWFLNGTTINGATSNTYNAIQAGIYKVQVAVDNCISDFSNDQPIIITGGLDDNKSLTSIYPNPVHEELMIDLRGFEKNKTVTISTVDLVGRQVNQLIGEGGTEVKMDVRSMPVGRYIITLQQNKHIEVKSFIKSVN